MTRTLTCFIALCALGAPALAGGSLATAEASTASAKSDFVFGQTTYRRSDTNIVADGISMRPSQSSSTPSTLYVATDDGGNLTLDGAWQQDVGMSRSSSPPRAATSPSRAMTSPDWDSPSPSTARVRPRRA